MGKLKEQAEPSNKEKESEVVAVVEGQSGTQVFTKEVTSNPSNKALASYNAFSQEKIDLIKLTCCKNSTDTELEMFLHVCQRTGLDPLLKQIHAVKRFDKSQNREVMSIQVGVDGYRLIAERTGRYAPGRDTEYHRDKNGNLISAKAYVKKTNA